MGKRIGFTSVVAVFAFAAALQCVAQETVSTFHGYKGDTRTWTDRIVAEKGTIRDEIKGAAGRADREVTTLPGRVDGEIFAETMNGLPSHRVVVKGEYVNIYEGPGMTGMVMVEAPPLVFDATVPSHYGMLMERYNASRGGTQKIPVIVPEKGDYCNIEISPRPATSIPVGEAQLPAKVYQFRIEFNQYATVWLLGDAVAAVHVGSTDEYMVDAKYPMLHEKIQMIVRRSM